MAIARINMKSRPILAPAAGMTLNSPAVLSQEVKSAIFSNASKTLERTLIIKPDRPQLTEAITNHFHTPAAYDKRYTLTRLR